MLLHILNSFLIFNTVTHRPVFAIEVDGATFHAPESKQGERDRRKDEIFSKAGLPIHRFRTDQSSETERLREVFQDLQRKPANLYDVIKNVAF